ncbi:glycosyltransferase [Nocardioides psychrotolerans]|uniref:glycosyltransferase n=1 Tax=Nocardioides psychrotolerans TaxID=1005945 RepID=UPI0031377A9B
MQRLVVVQPYLPRYRVALFDLLSAGLQKHNVTLRVVAPPASGMQALRGDDEVDHPWLDTSRRWAPGIDLKVSYLGSRPWLSAADAIIVPASATVLDTHLAFTHQRRRSARIGLWGHIDNFVKPANKVDVALERRHLKRADHVFAYSQRGATFALRQGVSPARISVLNNTIDTEVLTRTAEETETLAIQAFRSMHNLENAKVFSVLGGLDADKEVPRLAKVLDLLSHRRDIKFLVAGNGAQAHLLADAEQRGQVIRLGYVGDAEKALMARTSLAFLNLGRVGLVAVDALALQTPLITVIGYSLHAPEYEYLVFGRDVFEAPDDDRAIADFLSSFAPPEGPMSTPPSIAAFVGNFETGILRMLA